MIIESINDLKPGGYDAVEIDCPWHFRVWNKDTGSGRSAESYYKTLEYEDLVSIPIRDLMSVNSLAFMWVVSPMLDVGIELGKRWGLTFVNIAFDWLKTTKTGKPAFGMGYFTRQNNELCLLFKKGKPKRASASVPMALISPRLAHSQKPIEAKERIEWLLEGDKWYEAYNNGEYCPLTKSYLEVFARQERREWDCIGNELGNRKDIREVLNVAKV